MMAGNVRVGAIAAAGILAMAASGAAASVLVVRSSGPSSSAFPAGKAIGDNQAIRLKANDMVVLLDSRGTRTLRGPGNFSASSSASSSGGALAALTSSTDSRRVRPQAVRGGPTGASQRNVWQADLARSGTVCIANPSDLGLYRSRASGEAHVTLTNTANGKSAAVHFDPGQSFARWPSDLPVANGSRIAVKGAGEPATLELKLIQPVPSGLEGMAQSFIRNDCQAQLDVLIDTFTAPTAG